MRSTMALGKAPFSAIQFATSDFEIEDAWPVVTEPFMQWVIEDQFSDGRPEFEKVLDTDLLKLWAAVGELVLDNPLHEGLCDNGPCVLALMSRTGLPRRAPSPTPWSTASHLKHQPRTKKNYLDVVDILDNLDTDLLKLWAAVGELVLDNPLHEGWIAEKGAFPNAMVDRITPQTSAEDKKELARDFEIGEGALLGNPVRDIRVTHQARK
jgi:hypothetical protein